MPRFEIDFLDEYSDEALLGELRRIAALLPKSTALTGRVYKNCSPKVAHSTICHRFGGWKEALEKAGLAQLYHGPPISQKMRSQPGKHRSNEDLVAELTRVHALLGKQWLTTDDFNAHSVMSEDVVRRRFGTFRKGLEAAGIPFKPNKLPQFTSEECFENLASVWTHYGRSPNYREMFRSPSKIQAKTYVRRWGTWRKAIRAFVQWANAPDQAKESVSAEIEARPAPELVQSKPTRAEANCREVRPRLQFQVFKRDHFRCVYCGRSPATHPGVILHADHVRAVKNGGKTTLDNLQTLCERCNLGKGTSDVP